MKCRKKKNIHWMDTGGRNDISPKLLEKTDSQKSFSSFSPKHTTRRFPPVFKKLPVFLCRLQIQNVESGLRILLARLYYLPLFCKLMVSPDCRYSACTQITFHFPLFPLPPNLDDENLFHIRSFHASRRLEPII